MSTNDITLSGERLMRLASELTLDHVAVTDGVLSLAYRFSANARAMREMIRKGVDRPRSSHRPSKSGPWYGSLKRYTARAVRSHRWQQLRDTGRLPLKGCDPLAVVCPGVHPSRHRWWIYLSLSLPAGRLP